jgi:hypothetical protein
MLRHFSRNIKGSDTCAENWWIDLRRLLAQLEDSAQNYSQAEAIRGGTMIAMSNAS